MSLRKIQGFTLIEILIVILIIGITLGFALIAFGDFGESRRILFAAEQLANTIELAEQRAILETSTLGLRIDNSSYQLMKLKQNKNWSTEANRGMFKINYFPKNMVIGLNIARHAGAPLIIINPSGETTVFSINLGTLKHPNMVRLIGKGNGSLILLSEQNK